MKKKIGSPKKLVVKSNRLIEAKSKLSIQEQRILLTAISQIKPTEEDFNEKGYAISIAEFRELADLKGRAYYTEIKELTHKLVGRTIVIHEEDGILQTSWLSSAKYVDQQGIVYLSFDERLKPYLIQLKKEFTSYQLHYVMKLKSKYSTRIYELLKQYEKIGHREFTLDELREKVSVEDGKYEKYGDFNRNVVKKAQSEINKNTDIQFIYTPRKQGRKVVGIHFTIQINQDNVDAAKKEIELLKLVEPLMELVPEKERNDQRIRNLLKKYIEKKDLEYIKWNILYSNSKNYSDYFKYLAKALSSNYGKNYQYQLFEEKEKRARQLEKEKNEAEERERIIQENKAWEEDKRQKIEGLPEIQRDMLFEIAVSNYAQKRRKNINKIDPNSYGVFMEAANIIDDFINDEIVVDV